MTLPNIDSFSIAVLVIDDDDLVRAGLSAFLQGVGLRAIECMEVGAVDRLDPAERACVCAVVTDFLFPVPPTGADALAAVRRAFPDTPVIVLTGDTSDAPRHAAALVDARLHHKPVRAADMVDALTAAYYGFVARRGAP